MRRNSIRERCTDRRGTDLFSLIPRKTRKPLTASSLVKAVPKPLNPPLIQPKVEDPNGILGRVNCCELRKVLLLKVESRSPREDAIMGEEFEQLRGEIERKQRFCRLGKRDRPALVSVFKMNPHIDAVWELV